MFVLLFSLGCDAVREMGQNAGVIGIRDINEANYVQAGLPSNIGIGKDKIRVNAGAKDTKVLIKGKYTQTEKNAFSDKIEDFRKNHFMTYSSDQNKKYPLKPITLYFDE